MCTTAAAATTTCIATTATTAATFRVSFPSPSPAGDARGNCHGKLVSDNDTSSPGKRTDISDLSTLIE